MKQLSTLLLAGLIAITTYAQTTVDVITGENYVNDAYYSLRNGTIAESNRINWDIAFTTSRYDVNILCNNGAQAELYTYYNGDISDWSHIDTSGLSTWKPMYNSIDDFNDGAFLQNIDTSNQFDYGWGVYNMLNHYIVGDSFYIIKTAANDYKKLCIIEKDPNEGANTWKFKYANIDGSEEQTITLEADSYASQNFIYYSISENAIVNKEPDSDEWDLQFTRYFDYNIPYYVSGVLLNSSRVSVQQVDGVNQASYNDYSEDLFTDTLSVIGYDWKVFNMGTMTYDLNDNRVFFVKVMENNGMDSTYWKMYFTGFSGASTGTYTLVQEVLESTLAVNTVDSDDNPVIYPNPATDVVNINIPSLKVLSVRIFNVSGKVVFNQKIESQYNLSIRTDNLKSGFYTVSIMTNEGTVTSKLIKR